MPLRDDFSTVLGTTRGANQTALLQRDAAQGDWRARTIISRNDLVLREQYIQEALTCIREDALLAMLELCGYYHPKDTNHIVEIITVFPNKSQSSIEEVDTRISHLTPHHRMTWTDEVQTVCGQTLVAQELVRVDPASHGFWHALLKHQQRHGPSSVASHCPTCLLHAQEYPETSQPTLPLSSKPYPALTAEQHQHIKEKTAEALRARFAREQPFDLLSYTKTLWAEELANLIAHWFTRANSATFSHLLVESARKHKLRCARYAPFDIGSLLSESDWRSLLSNFFAQTLTDTDAANLSTRLKEMLDASYQKRMA
jgi:hypothetical protein